MIITSTPDLVRLYLSGPTAAPMIRITDSPHETFRFGADIGRRLDAGDVVTLSGELGAGKTALAQGICAGLGVTEAVSSPTFALVHEYGGRLPVWHLDTYRVSHPDELIDLSWQELLQARGVVLVEWPERIAAALPAARMEIRLSWLGEECRRIELRPLGERMERIAAELTPAGAGVD